MNTSVSTRTSGTIPFRARGHGDIGEDSKGSVESLLRARRSLRQVGIERCPDDLRQGLAVAPHHTVDPSPLLRGKINLRSHTDHIQHSIQQSESGRIRTGSVGRYKLEVAILEAAVVQHLESVCRDTAPEKEHEVRGGTAEGNAGPPVLPRHNISPVGVELEPGIRWERSETFRSQQQVAVP
jgi:hypothetical protein